MNRRYETDELCRLVAKELNKTELRTEKRGFVPVSKCKEVVDAVFNAIFKRLEENKEVLVDGFLFFSKFKTKDGKISYYIKEDKKRRDVK